MSTSDSSPEFPAELIAAHEYAEASPGGGEGSLWHLRTDLCWQIEDDFRRAARGDESVRSEYEIVNSERPTCARIQVLCVNDARNALDQWRERDSKFIRAEIGTTGEIGEVKLSGDAATDIGAAVREEHYCTDDASCDIERARADGFPFWAASLLEGATDCPLLGAVIVHHCARGLDFAAAADADRVAWLETDTWARHAYTCASCNSITFGDDYWTPSDCGNCGESDLTPTALADFDLDGFVGGYLDGILFTESLNTCGFAPEGGFDGYPFCEDSSLLDYGLSRDDFAADAVASLRGECADFLFGGVLTDVRRYCELRGDPVRCAPDSFGRTEYSAAECAGTDFWLSRNGHGAGFFDRGNDPVFRRLQEAAQTHGETYVQFDGSEITV